MNHEGIRITKRTKLTVRTGHRDTVAQRHRGTEMFEVSELVAVSTFRSLADAQIAKGILDEVGIESMVRSDNAGGMYPALAGADLLVRGEDLEKAHEALGRRHQRSPDD